MKIHTMTTIKEIAVQFADILQPREVGLTNGYNVITATKAISKQLRIPIDKIIGCRPEDGSGNRWLYTECGQPEKYVELR